MKVRTFELDKENVDRGKHLSCKRSSCDLNMFVENVMLERLVSMAAILHQVMNLMSTSRSYVAVTFNIPNSFANDKFDFQLLAAGSQ